MLKECCCHPQHLELFGAEQAKKDTLYNVHCTCTLYRVFLNDQNFSDRASNEICVVSTCQGSTKNSDFYLSICSTHLWLAHSTRQKRQENRLKWLYFAYHVGKGYRYDRFRSNSSRPMLRSPLMHWNQFHFYLFSCCFCFIKWGNHKCVERTDKYWDKNQNNFGAPLLLQPIYH